MNFDDYVKNERKENNEKARRAMDLIKYEIAVIGCDRIGTGALRRALWGFYEPDLFVYNAFGFSITGYKGDRSIRTSSFRGYNVTPTDSSTYRITEKNSYGTSHRFHMAIEATIDMANVNNPNHFRILLRDATDALKSCKELMIKHHGDEAYIQKVKKSFYEKIRELSHHAKEECGIRPVESLNEAREKILNNCKRNVDRSGKPEMNRDLGILLVFGMLGLMLIITILSILS